MHVLLLNTHIASATMSDTSLICAGLLMLRRSSASSSDSNCMTPEDSPLSEIQAQLDERDALSTDSSNSMQVESPALAVHPQVDESTLNKAGISSDMQAESPPDEHPAIRLQLDETVVRRVEPAHKRAHSDLEMDATTAPSTPDSDLGSSGRDSPAPWLSRVEDICESPSKLRRTAAAAAAADASGSSSSGLARGYYSFSDSEDEKSDDSTDDSDSAAAASQQQQPAVAYTLMRKRKKKVSRFMGPPAVSAEPKVPNRGKKQDVKWFTAEEDEALTAAVQELGDTDWKLIAEQVGTHDAVQVSNYTQQAATSCSLSWLSQPRLLDKSAATLLACAAATSTFYNSSSRLLLL
jgi:Myb-like DNA-binding domain